MAVLTAVRQLLTACAKPWHPQARSPNVLDGEVPGRNGDLGRPDRANLRAPVA
jgi:hypothetical protein